jgi:hypothetical protein
VLEDIYLTAPDGPMVATVHPSGAWPWIAVALGAGLITVGGLLLSPSVHDHPAPAGHSGQGN